MRAYKKGSWLNGLRRMLRYRLQIPMMRSVHTPEYTARGVMIGIVWAMTPFFGIQMLLVLLTWLILSRLCRWDFSLINALAWVWVTNVFTVVPVFYVFYITGQMMLGNFGELSGYQNFKTLFTVLENEDLGFWMLVLEWLKTLASDIGWPLLIGSIPWAIASGWLAYELSLKFIIRYRRDREHRMLAARRSQ